MSAAVGFPVTNQLLPRIIQRIDDGTLFTGDYEFQQEDARSLNVFIRRLLPGLDQVDSNTQPLVTEVLSLIDHLLLSGTAPFPSCSREELRRVRRMMELAIFRVLKSPYSHREPGEIPRVLTELITQLRGACDVGQSVTIVSTNYDVAVEAELFRQLGADLSEGGQPVVDSGIGFGMTWRDVLTGVLYTPPLAPRYQVLKLHGSMNWLRCALCEQVYVNPRGTIEHNAFHLGTSNFNTCHCGHARLEAVMVAPSLVRDMRDGGLIAVWRSAIEAMRSSGTWVFVGYSLPTEDVAIRTALIRAYQASSMKPQVWVAQRGFEARGRYELLFPGCRYLEDGVEQLINAPAFAS